MQSQLVCGGCRTRLLYPRGAQNVCCAVCNAVTPVQPSGLETDQIICGCCHTLLMYTRGATSIRCSCCHTVIHTNVNPVPVSNQVATVRCGSCQITLMYQYGAPSVKCAVCHFITHVGNGNGRTSNSFNRPHGVANSPTVQPSASVSNSPSQTVVVENPMSFDESGKLVSNVVVGVTTKKK